MPPRPTASTPNTKGDPHAPAWSAAQLRETKYSHSLERGLAILGRFTPERPVLGIGELAEELGMARPTTHRYVTTLAALGYLERDAARKYRLGLRVTALGMSALNATTLREHAHPYLEDLSQQSSYTASLAVRDGAEIVVVDRARSLRRSHSETDVALPPGCRQPVYCTATGKALLAYLPDWALDDLLPGMTLTRHGPNTITSKNALRDELEHVRQEGFAVADEELAPKLYTIAAPVRNDAHEVRAAVNLAAHSATIALADLVDALGPQLLATVDRISACLGYRREDE
jgi:IclR family transcriptional regulator, pca regulon regulatory protein